MDAESIIADAKRRLLALAEQPPFRFIRTSQTAAQRYMRQMTTFEGYSAEEIALAETTLGVQFTDMFRAYLRQMGKLRGQLFCGSTVAELTQIAEFRTFGQKLIHETNQSLALPKDAIVLLTHQGYEFTFIEPRGGFDCPVLHYTETDQAPKQIADSFAHLIDAELALMENNDRRSHETGGYYITVDQNGVVTMNFPSLASGDRATSKPFELGG